MPADETVKTLKTLTHYPAHQSHLCAIYNLQGVIKKLAWPTTTQGETSETAKQLPTCYV